MERRLFLQLLGLTPLANVFEKTVGKIAERAQGKDICTDESFWKLVRQAFPISPNIINLNNAGMSSMPQVVQDALERYQRISNELPTYYMKRVLEQNKEPLRYNLAKMLGCEADEIAIQRNATESLNNVIWGLPLQAGDEVVVSKHDYPNMVLAWKQREIKDQIKLKWVDLPVCEDNAQALADRFINLFTPKTKLVYLTHIINWTGQTLPCKIIAEKAKAMGIEVALDSAQTIGQLDFRVTDFPVDYLATSLHKWLCAPVGTSLLYVKKDKIAKITPLFATLDNKSPDIRKFEVFGTHSVPVEIATGQALEFQESIGIAQKQARLQYLTDYWTSKAQKLERFELLSTKQASQMNALALFRIKGKKVEEVVNTLYSKFKIHLVQCVWENIEGVRISPNVYTSLKELDKFVEALAAL